MEKKDSKEKRERKGVDSQGEGKQCYVGEDALPERERPVWIERTLIPIFDVAFSTASSIINHFPLAFESRGQ